VSQTVDQAQTSTVITSSPVPSVAGQPVVYTAKVAVATPGAGTPTGTVTFSEGTMTACDSVPVDAKTGTASCRQSYTGARRAGVDRWPGVDRPCDGEPSGSAPDGSPKPKGCWPSPGRRCAACWGWEPRSCSPEPGW
jgi:hypothetical protein